MNAYEIVKGVTIPEFTGRGRYKTKYPFIKMEVGDSFYVKDAVSEQIHAACHHGGKRNGMKFTARKIGNGYRVWRVA